MTKIKNLQLIIAYNKIKKIFSSYNVFTENDWGLFVRVKIRVMLAQKVSAVLIRTKQSPFLHSIEQAPFSLDRPNAGSYLRPGMSEI